MNTASFINNFNHKRALIISDDFSAVGTLGESLKRMGVGIEYISPSSKKIDLSKHGLCVDNDVLFLDGDLNINIEIPFCSDRGQALIPIIGMVGIEAPSRLNRLFSYGATAFIKKPIHTGTVFFNLYLAVNTYNKLTTLTEQLNDYKERRRNRRYVIKAMLILMNELKISDDEAYQRLRKESMNSQTSLETYSKRIVKSMARNETVI